jgi:hypothetical protein
MGTTTQNALIQALNTVVPDITEVTDNSTYCQLHHGEGTMETKEITIAGTGAEVITNVFEVECSAEMKALYGVFTDVTDVTTASGCWFDLWDGTNSVAITNDGVNCSGATLNSFVGKLADDSQALTFAKSDQCRYSENANAQRAFFGGMLTAKEGATTYVRFRMDTDANTDCQIRFHIIWSRRCSGARTRPVA